MLMCGRFTLTFTVQEAQKEFDVDKVIEEFSPNYNVAPMQNVPVVVAGSRILDVYRWGLIPHWAKDPYNKIFVLTEKGKKLQDKLIESNLS